MIRIMKIVNRYIIPKESGKVLGRWNIEKCNNTINSKVDMANEDHCGPCGQYAISKNESNNYKEKDDINYNKKD